MLLLLIVDKEGSHCPPGNRKTSSEVVLSLILSGSSFFDTQEHVHHLELDIVQTCLKPEAV